jgi:hypothetical protein
MEFLNTILVIVLIAIAGATLWRVNNIFDMIEDATALRAELFQRIDATIGSLDSKIKKL